MKQIFTVLLLALAATVARADELLFVPQQSLVPGSTGDNYFTVELKNDDNVYVALQFDLYLPDGVTIDVNDNAAIYLSEERFTYRRGSTTHVASCTWHKEGFYRILVYGQTGNPAIPGHSGALCEVYYLSASTLHGTLPVTIDNVVLGISSTEGVKPPAQTTYLTVDTGDAVQSPQCTITSAPIYTLSGVRMGHTQLPRGVYIIAGRKIVVP